MKRILLLLISLAFAAVAHAQDLQCPKDKLVIGTGTPSGTYALVFDPITRTCDAVCENRNTEGGWDNITQMMANRFDGGIVQIDLLEFLSRTEPRIKRQVRSIASLHGSQLHIFTPSDGVKVVVQEPTMFGPRARTEVVRIKSLTDLKNRKVAAWSSSAVTATIVDERLKLNLTIIEVKKRAEGLKLLQDGEVFAFFAMGGKPIDWVEGTGGVKREVDKNLMLVPVDKIDIDKLGAPYYGERVTYRDITNSIGVPTISVRNELVVNNVQTGPVADSIQKLQACFKSALEESKQYPRGFVAAWSDISQDNASGWEGWVRQQSVPALKK